MLYCNRCGSQNSDDAKFCDRCGSPIIMGQKPGQAQAAGPAPPQPPGPPPEDFGDRFGREMSSAGERFGREMSKLGERLDREFGGVGRRWETRHEQKFSLVGPFIGALICWGILVLIILGIQAAKTPDGNAAYPDLGLWLGGNVFLFFGLLILFGYVNHAHKRFRKQLIWVLPVSVAAGLTILSWLAAGALSALANDTGRQDVADAAAAGRTFLPAIFLVIVVIGYIVVLAGSRGFRKDVPIPPGQAR